MMQVVCKGVFGCVIVQILGEMKGKQKRTVREVNMEEMSLKGVGKGKYDSKKERYEENVHE